MTSAIKALRERLAELDDLRTAGALLGWDQNTMMPPAGGPRRAETMATVERIRHERFIDPEVGRLLEAAGRELNGADPASDDASLVRRTQREWSKARRVPAELAAELTKAASVGQEAWIAARRERDFSQFVPHLERNLELARRYAACFEDFECPYDALLDDYEPDMSSREVRRLFAQLRDSLVRLSKRLEGREVDASVLHGKFPVRAQRELAERVLSLMGFNRRGWRLDEAVHPFAESLGRCDVRITTRWDESYFPAALFATMHECGHGLYEAGIAPSLDRTPLAHGLSLGVHESQSRLWENMVGRGHAFAAVLAPMVAEAFGGELAELDPETFFRAVNRTSPSLIRVEADELTYGLHIILRFELEQDLLEERLQVEELPDAWNAKVSEYLGIEVPDDSSGVLQDIHWSAGLIGYFPTYALGNMIAGQLWRQAHLDLPDLERQLEAGELSGLREWLREHVHSHGAKFTTTELLERVAGEGIRVEPLVQYLSEKLGKVYQVTETQTEEKHSE